MPTITSADRVAPVSTVAPTHPGADAKRAAAIAIIEGAVPKASPDASSMRQDAPGQAILSAPTLTPSKEQTPPISAPDANQTPSDMGKRLADMARKEKQAWSQIKQLKAEKEELAKAREGRLTKDEFMAQMRKDPTSVGFTYDELGQMYLSQGAPQDPNVARLQAQIEELKQGQQKVVSQAEKAQQDAYNQALAQIDKEAKALISKTDAYEVTRSQGAEQAVTKLIELTYQEEGVLMDVEEAAAQVEAYLEQEALSLFNKSPKLSSRLRDMTEKSKQSTDQQAPSAEAGQVKQSPNPQTQKTNTLTHAMSQASSKPMDRRQRAILAFQGKLK